MLKKSLFWEAAVLLTAVFLVFAGCEGPAGPEGRGGNDGSDVPFPGEITVTMPGGNNVPTLPAGVTYPPLSGAKILSGSAAEISTAFNGGILVANTPDSGDGSEFDQGTNGGTVYAQDAVDYVVWTGPDRSGNAQGTIVVPPGKTLFIAAPLTIDVGGADTFQGITVSDKGTFSPEGTLSIQAAVGGTSVDQNSPEGKVVILNGGYIDGAGARPVTIGGTLEIHHGAYVDVGAATFLTTAKSSVNVYGKIEGSAATALTFDGDLTIKGGGTVIGSSTGTPDVFRGAVTVESYARLELGNTGGSRMVHFYGPVDVKADAELLFNPNIVNPVTFHNVTTIGGTLNAYVNTVSLVSDLPSATAQLKVASTGKINATSWGLINQGTDNSLLAAIAPGASPSSDNRYTTIDVSGADLVVFNFTNELPVSSYGNLRLLASSESLSLLGGLSADRTDITYGAALAFDSNPLLITTNDVRLDNYGTFGIGDVTVGEEKTLTITDNVTRAGNITVLGALDAQLASFNAGLGSLTIGSETAAVKDPDDVKLYAVTFAVGAASYDPALITVNSGSKLRLGPVTPSALVVNPVGAIDLWDDASLTITGNTSTLDRLTKLTIYPGAVFDSSASNAVTFDALEELTVNGRLDTVLGAGPFDYLQTVVGSSGDVGGDGVAVFGNWDVTHATNHAFDQVLAIKDVTVRSIAETANTTGGGHGTEEDFTPDAAATRSGEGYILRAVTVASSAPGGNLTVDRDLNILAGGSLVFGAADRTVTIQGGAKILVGTSTPILPARPGLSVDTGKTAVLKALTTTDVVLAASVSVGGVGTLTANSVLGTGILEVQPGSALNVDGNLTVGTVTSVRAGKGTGLITLGKTPAASSLEKGVITTTADDTNVTAQLGVSLGGVLTIGGASTVGQGSSVGVSFGGLIKSTSSLAFSLTSGTADGVHIGTGTIGALSNTGTITADATDGNATITGDLIAEDGATVLNSIAAKVLTISGSFTINNGNSYDSLKINDAVITGAAVFNAFTNTASLTLDGILAGGSTSTLLTKGTGVLVVTAGSGPAVPVASLRAYGTGGTSPQYQSLNGAILTGNVAANTVQLTGNLSLIGGSTLDIAQTLNVGFVSTTDGTLTVNGGTINLPTATASKIVLAKLDTYKGTLIIGTGNGTGGYTLEGVASGGPVGAVGSNVKTSGAMGSNDISGAFITGINPSLVTGTAGAGAAGTDAITIQSVGNATIKANSVVYSTTMTP
jgi:hypothetical protein